MVSQAFPAEITVMFFAWLTHVMINDPTRGYGIFIENMLEEAKNAA